MSSKQNNYLTIDQALLRLSGLGYLPENVSVMEMVEAFAEEAEVERFNASSSDTPPAILNQLELHHEVSVARFNLCSVLHEQLIHETAHPNISNLDIFFDKSGDTYISVQSLIVWSAYHYGIDLSPHSDEIGQHLPPDTDWKNVTLRLLSDYRIKVSDEAGTQYTTTFRRIGLQGINHSTPNKPGIILLGLTSKKQYPFDSSATIKGADRKSMTGLRKALQLLTGLSSDPFTRPNHAIGWKPQFTILDRSKAADERAKKEAVMIQYDDNKSYEDEKDETADWLQDHAQ